MTPNNNREFPIMDDAGNGRGQTQYDLNEMLTRRLEEESEDIHDEEDFNFLDQNFPMI